MGIKILAKETIEKITAGEVVERPVSAVKELVENSIDAGATGITVEIMGGGAEYLRVTDNGCGIPENEVKLAFQSHATSKLKDAEGLTDIQTMGFRGEALPSIASVSKVTMTTKTRESETGIRIGIQGGTITEIAAAGCPDGTTITVKDLFYNVPVRRTFLKKAAYEQSLISELMQKLAIGNTGIAFKFISSGKTLLQTYGDGDLMHACVAVFGSEFTSGLRSVSECEGSFTVKGFIGTGDQAAPTRARQFFYLNGRLINCRMLSQAVEEACRGRVTIGRYPSCALFVTTAAPNVDINVHPSKLEVRFRDEAAFRLTVQTLLKKCFADERMIEAVLPKQPVEPSKPVLTFSKPQADEKPVQENAFDLLRNLTIDVHPKKETRTAVNETPFAPLEFIAPEPKQIKAIETEINQAKPESIQPTLRENAALQSENTLSYRLIGTYLNTYILIESDESLILIDQHAAHERLNYEEFTRRLSDGVASQQLLVPIILDVSPREEQILSQSRDVLAEAGYETEIFGNGSIKVSAVPFIYGSSDLKLLFSEMIDSLDMLKKAEKSRRLDSVIQASCKHAVKGGDKLTDAEIRALLSRVEESQAAPTCPHGRPVMKVFTKKAVEQLFKRIQ